MPNTVETIHDNRRLFLLKSWSPEVGAGAQTEVLGAELPAQVGQISRGPLRALCTGPGEWLLVFPEAQRAQPDARPGVAIVEVTDGFAVVRVQGALSRELLSKGCGLDFDPREFPAGRCARTRFAQIPLFIECVDAPDRFDLYVARSYLAYLEAWLADALVELK